MYDTDQLRRRIRAQRRALSPETQKSHSLAVIRRLGRSGIFLKSRRIALYIENDGEISVTRMLPMLRRLGKSCYLPVLRPMLPNRLWFSEYRPGDKLTLNRYGIPEPDIKVRKPISCNSLDLVLMPLVGFDSTKNRIGMGGGFYDRTFSYRKIRRSWYKPSLIGIAHELQKLDSIRTNSWDVPLDGVVTESNFYR